jgi:hypothetical protein
MKTKNSILKRVVSTNPRVNADLLAESMRLSRKLAGSRSRAKSGYSLPSQFDKRMVKTTVEELLAKREAERTSLCA